MSDTPVAAADEIHSQAVKSRNSWRLLVVFNSVALVFFVTYFLIYLRQPMVVGFPLFLTTSLSIIAVFRKEILLRLTVVPRTLMWAMVMVLCVWLGAAYPIGWFSSVAVILVPLTLSVLLLDGYSWENVAHPRWWVVGAGVVFVTVFGVRVYTLSAYPGFQVFDEAWLMSMGKSVAETGRVEDLLMLHVSDAAEASEERYVVLLGLWYRLFGVGLWQGRLLSLILTGMTIFLTSLAADGLINRRVAWLTALVLLSSNLLYHSVQIRYEAFFTATIALGLWLIALGERTQRTMWYGFAGFAVGIGAFAHLDAALMGIAFMVAIFLPQYISQVRAGNWNPASSLLVFGAGGLVGGVVVFAVQILPGLDILMTMSSGRQTVLPAEIILTFIGNLFKIMAHSLIESMLIVIACVVVLIRKHSPGRQFLAALLVFIVLLSFINSVVSELYVRPLVPLVALIVAVFLEQLTRRFDDGDGVFAAAAVLPVLVVTLMSITTAPLQYMLEGKPLEPVAPPEVEWLQNNVEPGELIVGEHFYYFWLSDSNFKSVFSWVVASNSDPAFTVEQDVFWDDVLPVYIVMDETESRPLLTYFFYETDYLDSRGYIPAAEFDSPFGDIVIYQLPDAGD